MDRGSLTENRLRRNSQSRRAGQFSFFGMDHFYIFVHTHCVPHTSPVSVSVVIKASRPRSPSRRRHESPDVVVAERLISILIVYRSADADQLAAIAGARAAPHLPRARSVSVAQVEQRGAALGHHLLPGQLQPVVAVGEAFRRLVAEFLAADQPLHPV